ncbi:alcohol dehydrogenase catalytic domain-containing protein [Mesorhizobium sp. CA18]|uniref:alcohol dehydrogenase catalytic domain-containing protein n=1 Tax=unclassified Mesorhizobium TaxID=325217 RepID=UPI001CCB965E|nr:MULTISPECIES: alcohol dehydrogenase catalytic domain-containing protein [unclassified Mesorhizobium]MBZ9737140.1 alcohol dehydrogenase catalytic domain-containing protein [Mesorhizobium sp. CA9]MBZ9826588.1 alcohol dehydrogenase catalytic domain-containing protein [Mesorhizobium sp. CA18]MBZ9830815.1 alcohol dehydrogenase catalytic domain-containing protein [Mesorhizobium sp. CA2]MBZ9835509.1 alcohol dehydrogenase catalytic domain-containing protein [Mesorhizobium sp. CA3]MBZ9875807.1 alcoh
MFSGDRINLALSKSHIALVRPPGIGAPKLTQVRAPVVQPGDIVCRTLVAGVCGTDLQILRGIRDDPARILGHEGVAIVDEVAAKADERWLGTTIAVNPTPDWGAAELGHTLDGMMQQRFLVPARLRSLAVSSPAELPADLAILAEPLASVLTCGSILKQFAEPISVLVVGRGTIGQLLRLTLGIACESVRDVSVTGTKETAQIEHRAFDTVILCSSRQDAATALTIGLSALRDGGILYLFGGLPSEGRDPRLPGVNLNEVRARHTGGRAGRPFVEQCQTTIGHKRVRIAGHRGSSNAMLTRAMLDLCARPGAYRPLLTIVTDPEEAVRTLHDAVGTPPVRSWTKLGIDFRRWRTSTNSVDE